MDVGSGQAVRSLPRLVPAGEQDQRGAERWIAAGLQRGDDVALAALYDRYQRLIFSVAVRVVRDTEAAEELVQEVVLRAWQKASGYQPDRGSLADWLAAIARNLAIDELRRRRHRLPPAAGREAVGNTVVESRLEADPTTQLLAYSDRDVVLRALTALPQAQRRVMELAYYGGLSQAQIATLLCAPLGTVKTRMRLATRKLRVLLRDYPDESHWGCLPAG
jgi:RNA polymerase sigma-70 factor (ECF subfamily)